jgi:hypothetical protein
MIEKIKTIVKNKIAILQMVGAILIIISLFTPFAISRGLEGISISSQSNVWYWGVYQEQDQTFFLNIPFMLNIFLPMAMVVFSILILILSIEFGLNGIKRKLFGELIFILIVLIYLSMTLIVKLIEYSFSLMPDLEPVLMSHAPFWSYRLAGFGNFGLNIGMFLVIASSIISLMKSRKSFFYIEITIMSIWIISQLVFFPFFF